MGTAAKRKGRKQEFNDSRVLLALKGAWQIAPPQPEISWPPAEGQHRVLHRGTHRRAGPVRSPSVSLSCGCLRPAARAGLHSRAVFLCSTQQGKIRTVGLMGFTNTIVVWLILSHTTLTLLVMECVKAANTP